MQIGFIPTHGVRFGLRWLTRAILMILALAGAGLHVSSSLAQTTQSDGIALSLTNGGPDAVEVLFFSPGADGEPALGSLEPEEVAELEVEPGTVVVIVKTDPAETPADQRQAFMTVTVGAEPAEQSYTIPDPRVTQVVQTSFTNSYESAVTLFVPDSSAEGGVSKLDTIASGDSQSYPTYPGSHLIARSEDGAIFASYTVTVEAEQIFDLATLIAPKAPTASIEIINRSNRPVAVEEKLPSAIIRVAGLPPRTKATVAAVIGSELHVVTNDDPPQFVNSHDVSDDTDLQIVVEHVPQEIIAPPPGVDLSALPEEQRNASAKFLNNIKEMQANSPDLIGYIVYNSGSDPVWLAGLRDGKLVGAKAVKPKSLGNVVSRKGATSVAWKGSVPPDKVAVEDVHAVIEAKAGMPGVIDVTTPRKVSISVASGICKPLDLYRVAALSGEVHLGKFDPMQRKAQTYDVPGGALLIARARAGSPVAGQEVWRRQIPANGGEPITIEATQTGADPITLPRVPDGADKAPRTLIASNHTSRAVRVYTIQRSGAEALMLDGDGAPLSIPAKSDMTFYMPEGAAIVFRRPDTKVEYSEYGRYRVTAAPNQSVEIGKLRRPHLLSGTWIDRPDPALQPENAVATTFASFIDLGGGEVSGSTNFIAGREGREQFDSGKTAAAAKFEGCSDAEEAHGRWYAQYAGFYCPDNSVTDAAGNVRKAWGTFSARQTGDTLKFEYGLCGAPMSKSTTWWPLPTHYDDMDPSAEAFSVNMLEIKWAPAKFQWLGRGFNLLYADPMNFASTENPKSYSENQIFDFIYRDPAGKATQSTSKSIFGVRELPINDSSCTGSEKLVKTLADMRDFTQKAYSASVGVPQIASFSLSKSHSEANNASTGRDSVTIMERCDQHIRSLTVDARWTDPEGHDYLRQPLRIDFRRAVEQLPLAWGDGKSLLAFLRKFGTHFSERVVYGGTFYAKTNIKKETYLIGREVGDKLSLEASGTIKKVSLGGSYSNEETQGRSSNNAHSNSSYEKWSLGGNGSQVYGEWAPSVAGSPAPVGISFRPIHDLLTPVFFPADPDIGLKNRLVRQATTQYFRQFAGKDVTGQPPFEKLMKRDPRQVCVQMQALRVNFSRPAPLPSLPEDYFGGALMGQFVNAEGEPVGASPFTLALNTDFGSKSKRPDGLGAWARQPVNSFSAGDRAEDPSANPRYCTDMIEEDYVWNGSLCLGGTFHFNDSSSNDRWNGDCRFQPILLPLKRLERNHPVTLKDSVVLGSGSFDFDLKVWIP